MKLKKRLLKESRLYIIIDKKISGKRSIFSIANKIKTQGADIIQLRDKESKKETIIRDALGLRRLLLNTQNLFIINDYVDVAKIVDSDGLQLGQYDISIEIARRILGRDKIIGVSCHNLKQAIQAQNRGADYISIGPIYSSLTKPEYKSIGLDLIKRLKGKIKIPFFVIGGINQDNINKILLLGVNRVALCRAILQAKNISSSVKAFSKILQ